MVCCRSISLRTSECQDICRPNRAYRSLSLFTCFNSFKSFGHRFSLVNTLRSKLKKPVASFSTQGMGIHGAAIILEHLVVQWQWYYQLSPQRKIDLPNCQWKFIFYFCYIRASEEIIRFNINNTKTPPLDTIHSQHPHHNLLPWNSY